MITLGIYLILLFSILFTYNGALFIPFGMSDDYYHLARIIEAGGGPVSWAAGPKEGRIVQGLLLSALFKPQSISELTHYRIAALAGFSLFALLIYLILRRRETIPVALAFSLMVIALIPFQTWLAWSMLFLVSYAACLGIVAALLIDRAYRASLWRKALFLLAGIGVFWVSLNIYQPAAMTLWVAAAMLIFLDNPGLVGTIRRSLLFGLSGLSGLGLAFITMKIAQGVSGQSQARTDLVSDLPGKLSWFISQPLLNALNLHDLTPSPLTAILLGTFILTGLYLYFNGKWWQKVISILIAGGFTLLAYLPSLIIQENWSTYRTLAALSILFFFYLFLALKQFYTLIAARVSWVLSRQEQLFNLGMLASAAIILLFTSQFFTQRLALPLFIEHRFVKNSLASKNLAKAAQIDLIPPGWNDSVCTLVRYDEFCIPSGYPNWSREALARIVLVEIDPAYLALPINVIESDQEASPTDGAILIDLRKLRNFRVP